MYQFSTVKEFFITLFRKMLLLLPSRSDPSACSGPTINNVVAYIWWLQTSIQYHIKTMSVCNKTIDVHESMINQA